MKLASLLTLLLVTLPAGLSAQPRDCSEAALRQAAATGRANVDAGVAAEEARAAWNHVLDCGGSLAWPATLYNVDGRAAFVFTFDRTALRVYREKGTDPEAIVPWNDVREIESGNWVIWFRLRTPVNISSDRGRHNRVKELRVFLHGGDGGEITYHYNVEYVGRHWFWGTPVYEVTNLRGIAMGPTEYQRRVQGFLAEMFDPDHHIVLKRKGRSAGW